jgi:hypothetical protein
MNASIKFIIIFCFILPQFQAQESEIDRLMKSEFKMTFPSIYFIHNTTHYAKMPYSIDSCFKNISLNFDDNINSLVIWRDSAESIDLTSKRIKKLKFELRKYLPRKDFEIYAIGNEQKISRHTIRMTSDSSKINYLLSLNSVFDISKTQFQKKISQKESHILRPKIWCLNCWKSGFHLDKKSREVRKIARRSKRNHKS